MTNPSPSPSIYRPRTPRASPLWQLVHHFWSDFVAGYESKYRRIHGPLRPCTVEAVEDFQRRVRGTGNWIAENLCKPVPHRQFVFTIPRMLRGIFRKRRRTSGWRRETADRR